MTEPEPIRPHHTGIEVLLLLGPTVDIQVVDEPGECPEIQITWGSVSVEIAANSAFHDHPLAPCDLDRARDLRTAVGRYVDGLEKLWTQQHENSTTGGIPPTAERRGESRRG
jgi:hypothetical protein